MSESEKIRVARITRGNAINAAAASGIAKDSDSLLGLALEIEGFLLEAGVDSNPLDAPKAAAEYVPLDGPAGDPTTNVVEGLNAIPDCPSCGGAMWDNREKKKAGDFKPTFPDFSCKDRCGGKPNAIWLDSKSPSPRRHGRPVSDAAVRVGERVSG